MTNSNCLHHIWHINHNKLIYRIKYFETSKNVTKLQKTVKATNVETEKCQPQCRTPKISESI